MKMPVFGVTSTRKAVFCAQLAEGGMINVRKGGCEYRSSTSTSTREVENCTQRFPDEKVDIMSTRYDRGSDRKHQLFGMVGTRNREFGAPNTIDEDNRHEISTNHIEVITATTLTGTTRDNSHLPRWDCKMYHCEQPPLADREPAASMVKSL